MGRYNLPVTPLIDRLIDLALEEDIGHGDITTGSLGLAGVRGRGCIVAKEAMTLAGLELIEKIFRRFDPEVSVELHYADGDTIESPGTRIADLEGSLAALLTAERTVLNFLQRLSGIATHVSTYVKDLPPGKIKLVDTRKTVPGWRVLEKYSVRVGGALNHRTGLYDGVIVKDNHIAACRGIGPAVARIRRNISHLVRIEVEAANLEEVQEALSAGADVIMLDNMDDELISASVAVIGRKAEIEVSGGINRGRVQRLLDLGVDIVSVGALTHAARFVDLSMDIFPKENFR